MTTTTSSTTHHASVGPRTSARALPQRAEIRYGTAVPILLLVAFTLSVVHTVMPGAPAWKILSST